MIFLPFFFIIVVVTCSVPWFVSPYVFERTSIEVNNTLCFLGGKTACSRPHSDHKIALFFVRLWIFLLFSNARSFAAAVLPNVASCPKGLY